MKYYSHPENLDEDGYTQLDFRTRGIHKRPEGSEKGSQASSPPWRLIVVALGILCLVALVVASVLGVLGHFSGPCPLTGSYTRRAVIYLRCHKIPGLEEFIESQTSSNHINSFWIGLSRNQTEGPWFWEDGSPFIPNSFQVRDTASKESLLHNCVWIHGSEVFNQICNISTFSICEKQL